MSLSIVIDQLERLTSGILQRLETADFEEMSQFVNSRETLIDRIQQLEFETNQDPAKELSARINKLLELDPQILSKLYQLKQEAAGHLSKISSGRTVKSAYEVSIQTDGYYFDKKR